MRTMLDGEAQGISDRKACNMIAALTPSEFLDGFLAGVVVVWIAAAFVWLIWRLYDEGRDDLDLDRLHDPRRDRIDL